MKDIIQQFIEKVINLKERSFKDLNTSSEKVNASTLRSNGFYSYNCS